MPELNRLNLNDYISAKKLPVVIVLDNIRSLSNVGAFFRTADAFRIKELYLCGITACPPHREIHKTALGAEMSVPWEHCADTLSLVRRLKDEGYVVVAVEQTARSVKLGSFRREDGVKYAFIFGNEVDGVAQDVVDAADFSLEIPQYGTKHSLNVSVSVGIILWEVS